ncbi:hypothetical protein SDRG_06362 [Saprolegnia diclina VS20]|uniref:DUF924-domain-containing protein n=1 Tax=Saprolegnia diclina (strain VS20) TaxID=1156394 RepID=T0S0L7_SAPDV|nr:hypothetical protein SDRG_06362 [Saprolegnia diclina VS20]EQC36257.1 hypothetical protein SDRG_06362 [Saprolegnia diclina VS20]|eukprot:XP_008610363.1 hypothetical protein SDRG_06362 [Saprolegnia diclina VS20]
MASRVNSALCAKADAILKFWFGATYPTTLEIRSAVWFARNAEFDASVAASFGDLVHDLGTTSASALLPLLHANPFSVKVATVLCLDQFTRNLYRDDKRAFASDALASTFVLETLAHSEPDFLSRHVLEQAFFLMPLMHSEETAVHARAAELFPPLATRTDDPQLKGMLTQFAKYEVDHKKIIDAYGRYPHRNKVLGRESTPAEIEYLADPNAGF